VSACVRWWIAAFVPGSGPDRHRVRPTEHAQAKQTSAQSVSSNQRFIWSLYLAELNMQSFRQYTVLHDLAALTPGQELSSRSAQSFADLRRRNLISLLPRFYPTVQR